MRKTPTNNIAERCCVQGQQHNGDGSCLDNCKSNGDPLLSGQLEKVLTIITPASPLLTSISRRTNSCPNPMISLSHYFLIPFQTPTRRCLCQSRGSFQTPTRRGRKCGTGVRQTGEWRGPMWDETGKGEEKKVRGNAREMKIIGWFCSLRQQQWSSVNVGTDRGPYVKALIDSVREEGKYDGIFLDRLEKVCSRARK